MKTLKRVRLVSCEGGAGSSGILLRSRFRGESRGGTRMGEVLARRV